MENKKLKDKLKINSLYSLIFAPFYSFDVSLRHKKVNYKKDLPPAIYAIWHGRQFGLSCIDKKDRHKLSILISKSNDGEIIAKLCDALGYSLIRGSKGRGGAKALREIISALNNGQNIAYTVDGPKGPIYKVKEGIIKIAQLSQSPIIPMVPITKIMIEAKSWDKYQVPYPFVKVTTNFGDPLYVPKEITDEEKEHYRQKLEDKLFELSDVGKP